MDIVGNYTFDGPNKLIMINLGITTVDVDDIYSRSIDWLAMGDNLKYLPPFRTVGGDAISDVKDLGITFFIINGWRIRPQEASHRLTIVGNLFTDPSGFSPFVDTLGSFNVTIEMQVSSLVDSTLAQMPEIEQASFNGAVTIDSVNGTTGDLTYPVGTGQEPVKTLTEAQQIATTRGFDSYNIIGNLTIGASDNVTALKFTGQGATLNVARTTVTLTQNCITTNAHWKDCKLTGYQGGESIYEDCIIDGIDNAHCIYLRCGLLDGTSRGYTIRQSNAVSSGHASYFKECYSDEGTAILDRNGARLNITFDGFHGRLKIINQNHATSSGQVWIHLNGGVVTVDSTCTKGKITITGFGILVNNSQGTEVDASGFAAEVAVQARLDAESIRQTHQGFGGRWFVDPVNGTDLAPGNSPASPLRTLAAAISKAVSGRGDVVYLLAPGSGTATIDERVVVNKEDLHIRGPGRGIQIQPSTPNLGPVLTITSNNCSLSGFILRTPVASTLDDGIVISGKFSRLDKLYIVGSGQYGFGTASRGIVYTGGDYHELHDMEVEKFGDSGIELDDLSDTHSNGSPREISIFGGNIYLNGTHGLCLHGKTGAALGATSRLIRVLNGANIHDNGSVGIHSDANVLGVVIDDSVLLHANNGGNSNPQVELNGTGYYKQEEDYTHTALAIRTELAPELSRIDLAAAILRNKTITDPNTGIITVYADDGITPMFTANVYQDAAGTIPYQGNGADRRDRLV